MSKQELAKRFVSVANNDVRKTADAVVSHVVAAHPNPDAKLFKEDLIEFITSKVTSDAYRTDVAEKYAELFSEIELNELLQFADSKTGKKYFGSTTELASHGLEMANKYIAGSIGELLEIVEAKVSAIRR